MQLSCLRFRVYRNFSGEMKKAKSNAFISDEKFFRKRKRRCSEQTGRKHESAKHYCKFCKKLYRAPSKLINIFGWAELSQRKKLRTHNVSTFRLQSAFPPAGKLFLNSETRLSTMIWLLMDESSGSESHHDDDDFLVPLHQHRQRETVGKVINGTDAFITLHALWSPALPSSLPRSLLFAVHNYYHFFPLSSISMKLSRVRKSEEAAASEKKQEKIVSPAKTAASCRKRFFCTVKSFQYDVELVVSFIKIISRIPRSWISLM